MPKGNLHETWHVFAVEWEAGQIRWYLDDHLFKSVDRPNETGPDNWPFDDGHPFYIILNLAVGGLFDDYRNPPPGHGAAAPVRRLRARLPANLTWPARTGPDSPTLRTRRQPGATVSPGRHNPVTFLASAARSAYLFQNIGGVHNAKAVCALKEPKQDSAND